MKTLLLLSLLPLPLLASPPKKPLPSRYTSLETSSPFTTPAPPVVSNAPIVNPLEDWALGGVTKFPDGYFVILQNKKKPEEKVVIQPGMQSEFEVLEVIDGGMDYTETTVKLRYGSSVGVVEFDKKLLAVKAPSQNQPQGRHEPATIPGLAGREGMREGNSPRLRTIVPPTATPNQPDGQPAPAQAPQFQPRR